MRILNTVLIRFVTHKLTLTAKKKIDERTAVAGIDSDQQREEEKKDQ